MLSVDESGICGDGVGNLWNRVVAHGEEQRRRGILLNERDAASCTTKLDAVRNSQCLYWSYAICVMPRRSQRAYSGCLYNESYSYFRLRVARVELLCYINQVSERQCCCLQRGTKLSPGCRMWRLSSKPQEKLPWPQGWKSGTKRPVGLAVIAEPPEQDL